MSEPKIPCGRETSTPTDCGCCFVLCGHEDARCAHCAEIESLRRVLGDLNPSAMRAQKTNRCPVVRRCRRTVHMDHCDFEVEPSLDRVDRCSCCRQCRHSSPHEGPCDFNTDAEIRHAAQLRSAAEQLGIVPDIRKELAEARAEIERLLALENVKDHMRKDGLIGQLRDERDAWHVKLHELLEELGS